MDKEVFVASMSEGERIRLTRLMHHLRQIDVASMAKIPMESVTRVEKNRWIPEDHKERILLCLGLMDEQPEASNA
jgi:transcriptional regulator with XRE-family HTH domain